MDKKEKATELANLIGKVPGIQSCRVDDWDRHETSFSLVAAIQGEPKGAFGFFPRGGKAFDLRPVVAKIRTILKGHGFSIESPKRIYARIDTTYYFEGYEKGYLMIDLVPRT